jgi:uncharacterized protein (DUF486 family)
MILATYSYILGNPCTNVDIAIFKTSSLRFSTANFTLTLIFNRFSTYMLEESLGLSDNLNIGLVPSIPTTN